MTPLRSDHFPLFLSLFCLRPNSLKLSDDRLELVIHETPKAPQRLNQPPSQMGTIASKAVYSPFAVCALREDIRLEHGEHGEHDESITCPVCHSRVIGRLGNSQYYCWDCCVQFNRTDRGVQTFHIDEDGTLVAEVGVEDGPQHQIEPGGPPAVHHTTDQGGRWR